ncbi:ATPase inhibitor mai-2, mitochondrial-like isoform X2 [Plodia interpunctella]|uniref:ATPase inhibitor mai-2, mitochondrial-like isoform X2 n=1 Tax=Plodia interpunctella TaxID=58824 RepID=UPI002367C809|nr:ATPase inhibitor mai-2, mitochondrial-like isoform X1 [Plodia interpunctella]
MASAIRSRTSLFRPLLNVRMYVGEPGSGAGKGGGGGGSIREAGGSFGKMEAAREDEYFYKKQKEQLSNLKGHLDKEINFHQEQIKRHEDAIRRHKQQLSEMDTKN